MTPIRWRLQDPGITRREFVWRATLLGVAGSSLGGFLAACGRGAAPGTTAPPGITGEGAQAARPLTPTFYNWILSLYPPIQEFSSGYQTAQVEVKEAPVEGFGIERFVAEARNQESTWDVYVGMTPFVEMSSLIEAGVIEPWDPYLPEGVLDDFIPSVGEEATVDGQLFNFPFLVDVIVQAWNAELVEKAGLDPEAIPETWDEYLANAQQVVDSGAAPFGSTFDAHGWRSLAPITHTISVDVYREDGLFDFTHEATVEALEIMRRMKELANPNVLDPGTTDAGVNDTPDEGAFAAQQVAFYVKYGNAPIRFANNWPNPDNLRLGPLPKTPDGDGGTVFWTTGAALFTHGQNKEAAAQYMYDLVGDESIWRKAVGTEGETVGQLPPLESTWSEWESSPPDWLAPWTGLLRDQLSAARAIRTHTFGLQQFVIGQPLWETYLTGDESDAKKALQAAQDAVLVEVERDAG